MGRTFKIAQVRGLLNQVHSEEITFSKFVEELNFRANVKAKEGHDRLVELLIEFVDAPLDEMDNIDETYYLGLVAQGQQLLTEIKKDINE